MLLRYNKYNQSTIIITIMLVLSTVVDSIWYWYKYNIPVNKAHKFSSKGWHGQVKRHASAARKGWRNRR